MSTEHTPGPWVVSKPSGNYIDAPAIKGSIAALTYSAKPADARLMAAAPDLLAALKSATFALESAVMLAGLQALAEPAANARAALNRFYEEETNA